RGRAAHDHWRAGDRDLLVSGADSADPARRLSRDARRRQSQAVGHAAFAAAADGSAKRAQSLPRGGSGAPQQLWLGGPTEGRGAYPDRAGDEGTCGQGDRRLPAGTAMKSAIIALVLAAMPLSPAGARSTLDADTLA